MAFVRIVAPAQIDGPRPYVYLAGNGGPWRAEFYANSEPAALLLPGATFLDPWCEAPLDRRTRWEFDALSLADIIVFWLGPDTQAPFSLFELGYYLTSKKRLVLGAHHQYPLREELSTVLSYRKPGRILADNLHAVQANLLGAIRAYSDGGYGRH